METDAFVVLVVAPPEFGTDARGSGGETGDVTKSQSRSQQGLTSLCNLWFVIKQWTADNSAIIDASSGCISFFHLHSINDFYENFDTMISTALLITLVLAVTEAVTTPKPPIKSTGPLSTSIMVGVGDTCPTAGNHT